MLKSWTTVWLHILNRFMGHPVESNAVIHDRAMLLNLLSRGQDTGRQLTMFHDVASCLVGRYVISCRYATMCAFSNSVRIKLDCSCHSFTFYSPAAFYLIRAKPAMTWTNLSCPFARGAVFRRYCGYSGGDFEFFDLFAPQWRHVAPVEVKVQPWGVGPEN